VNPERLQHDDVCSSENDYIPSEDVTERENDKIITRKKVSVG